MKVLPCDVSSLDEVADTLNSGGVAVIPTDTVYGIAAHPSFPSAVERLYSIKGRDRGKKIALLAADAGSVESFGAEMPASAKELAAKHWPGALTMVLGGEGFRVPDHRWTRSLLARCGGVLRVTSANLSGGTSATDAHQALASVGLCADLVVDGGPSPGGVPSTVVKVGPDGSIEVLRHGAIRDIGNAGNLLSR